MCVWREGGFSMYMVRREVDEGGFSMYMYGERGFFPICVWREEIFSYMCVERDHFFYVYGTERSR